MNAHGNSGVGTYITRYKIVSLVTGPFPYCTLDATSWKITCQLKIWVWNSRREERNDEDFAWFSQSWI